MTKQILINIKDTFIKYTFILFDPDFIFAQYINKTNQIPSNLKITNNKINLLIIFSFINLIIFRIINNFYGNIFEIFNEYISYILIILTLSYLTYLICNITYLIINYLLFHYNIFNQRFKFDNIILIILYNIKFLLLISIYLYILINSYKDLYLYIGYFYILSNSLGLIIGTYLHVKYGYNYNNFKNKSLFYHIIILISYILFLIFFIFGISLLITTILLTLYPDFIQGDFIPSKYLLGEDSESDNNNKDKDINISSGNNHIIVEGNNSSNNNNNNTPNTPNTSQEQNNLYFLNYNHNSGNVTYSDNWEIECQIKERMRERALAINSKDILDKPYQKFTYWSKTTLIFKDNFFSQNKNSEFHLLTYKISPVIIDPTKSLNFAKIELNYLHLGVPFEECLTPGKVLLDPYAITHSHKQETDLCKAILFINKNKLFDKGEDDFSKNTAINWFK